MKHKNSRKLFNGMVLASDMGSMPKMKCQEEHVNRMRMKPWECLGRSEANRLEGTRSDHLLGF